MTDRLDSQRMALSAAGLHVAGGCLVLITLVVPGHEAAARELPVIAAIAIVFGTILAITGRHLPRTAYHLPPALGSALIGGLLAFDERRAAVAYGTMYTFVAIYVFYWFTTRAALVHMVVVVISCGVGLAARAGDANDSANLVMYCGAAVVTGVVVSWLVRQIRAAARLDALTGLPNRVTWEVQLERELARSRRDKSPVCAVILDLDDFKAVNDSAGHAAGDDRLREVASAWSYEIRAIDMLARWGGDEFALVLPGCATRDAEEIVERMRQVMPDALGVSAGIAIWVNHESVDALVDRADQALLHAKRGGRDRSVVAGPTSAAPPPELGGSQLD